MNVFICKFFNDDIERKISELVSAEKKRAGGSPRVFCVDEPTQKKLTAAGVSCETYHEFAGFGPEWEAVWDTLYEISDELRSSAESKPSLKYQGVNFLSLESNTAYYVYAIRLANLFRRMRGEKCGTLIVVVPRGYSVWVRDINSSNIKTLKYGRAALSSLMALYRHLSYQLRTASTGISARLRTVSKKTPAAATSDDAIRSERTHQKALFVVRTALYTRPALVISGECSKNGLMPYAATDDRSLAPQWRSRGIPCLVKPLFLVSLFTSAAALIKMLELYFRLNKHIKSFYASGRYASGTDEFSPVSMCRQALQGGLLPLCYEAVTDIVFLKKTLDAVKPDIVCLMPQDHLLQQIALALAKERGLPALACSAASEVIDTPAFQRHIRADKIATAGEKMRNKYIASGISPERVTAAGIAHFDLLFTRNREADKKVLADNGIDLRKKIIVFATDAYPVPETERMLTGVIGAVAKMKDTQLVVKVHPREEAAPYQALAARYPDVKVLIFKDFDLYALLHNCDLLITKGSTVALEAMIIDKPVVIINLMGAPGNIPYAEEEAAIGAYKDEEIEPAMMKALYDVEARSRLKVMRGKFVRNWAGEPDGKASHRIVTLMKEMISASLR